MAGSSLPAPCNINGIGVNCNLCPATWRGDIDTGQRAFMYMCAGQSYEISTCETSEFWDPQITITTTANVVQAFDQDGCGVLAGHSSVVFSPSISGTFFIRVHGPNCSTTPVRTARLKIQCFAGSCPGQGDNPCSTLGAQGCNPNIGPCPDTQGAIELGLAGSACNPTNATTAGYTGTTGIPLPNCGVYPNNGDIWFTAIVPASGSMVIELDQISATNLAMALYRASDCAGPFTIQDCNASLVPGGMADPRITIARPDLSGETVYVRVWPEGNMSNGGTFTICVRETAIVPNDHACNAMQLNVGSPCVPTEFELADATLEAGLSFAPSPTCGQPMVPGDVWFTAIIPESGMLTVVVNGPAGALPAIALYDLGLNNCAAGPFTQLACSSAPIGSPHFAFTLSREPGSLIYIRVWDRTATSGVYSICAFPAQAPVNDEPCGALPLELVYGCMPQFVNMDAATLSTSAPLPSCGSGLSDVWFTVMVPENGEVRFDSDDLGISDAALAVYRATNGSCDTDDLLLAEVAGGCATDGSTNMGAASMPALTLTDLAPGETLYIRVLNESTATGGSALCAGRTDEIEVVTGVRCYYTLRLFDSGGDGWGGSTVTLFANGSTTAYTLISGEGSISIPVMQGSPFLISYQSLGGAQNQISYRLERHGGSALFSSGSPPGIGTVFAGAADCNTWFDANDCFGGDLWQAFNPIIGQTIVDPGITDLDVSNQGCLVNGEESGHWYRVEMHTTGPFAMEITPTIPEMDLDFALWGPTNGQCPPNGPPVRCSFAAVNGSTGMDFTALDLSEGAAGDGWVQYLDVVSGENYILYISAPAGVSATYMIQRILPTDVDEATASAGMLSIHPNPTNGSSITIRWNGTKADPGQIRVMDAAGRSVITARVPVRNGSTEMQFPISELSTGTYVLELLDETGISIGRTRFVKFE